MLKEFCLHLLYQLEIGRLSGAVGELVVASPFTPRSWRLDNLQLSQGDEALMNCFSAQAEESSRFIDSLITRQVWLKFSCLLRTFSFL